MSIMAIAETERTTIERIQLSDAEFFLRLVNSPGWVRYIGDAGVGDLEEAVRYLDSGYLRSYRENGFGYYLVRRGQGEAIGICGFLKKPQLENVDFGFALLPEACGQGYAVEAARAVLDYGIRTYGFSVLDAVTSPENVRSGRLLGKLRFGCEGTIVGCGGEESLLFRWSAGVVEGENRGG